jgi:predicted transcriptional regulator
MPNDVLDAFEILEQALLELIEHRSKRLAALAQGLTEKHRPGARKRKLPF